MVTSTNVTDERKVTKRSRVSSPYRTKRREHRSISGGNSIDKHRRRHRVTTPTLSGADGTRYSTLWEFIDGIALYVLCISMPAIFGVLVHWYEDKFRNSTPLGTLFTSSSSTIIEEANSPFRNLHLWSKNRAGDNELLFQGIIGAIGSIYTKSISFLNRAVEEYMSTNALSDAQFLIVMSTLLALVRIILVRLLVPRFLAPRRLEAFVRCKSTHLLSSLEYSFVTPMSEKGEEGKAPTCDDSILQRSFVYLDKIWGSFYRTLKRFHPPQVPGDNLDATQTLRLISAPRYSTAIFRLLFCSSSCVYAYFHFRNTSFWPVWVGGSRSGSTRQCWDLSGSVSLNGSLDSDFDDANSSLRYFFLGQASYQVHSLGFHVLSMIVVALYGDRDGDSARVSMGGYWRTFFEHILYFLLTMVSFMFSGLRRLGAIAIFVLEASSVGLQLLQVCINSPEGSLLQKPKLISTLHSFVVVPIFVYCRFFVLPFIVQYSAIFESLDWIHQIEKVLSPGFGIVLYILFNFMILAAFGLNFLYLKRLLFHPYVENIKRGKLGMTQK